MAEVNDIAFLCVRLRELREKNDCNMEELAEKINIMEEIPISSDGKRHGTNKSSISRVESGKTGEKTLIEMAKKYCRSGRS